MDCWWLIPLIECFKNNLKLNLFKVVKKLAPIDGRNIKATPLNINTAPCLLTRPVTTKQSLLMLKYAAVPAILHTTCTQLTYS